MRWTRLPVALQATRDWLLRVQRAVTELQGRADELAAEIETVADAGSAPSGAAGGDLSGTYPDPTVTQARGLKSATTTVSVSAATAPTSGQVLTATGSTAATWQTPSSGTTDADAIHDNVSGEISAIAEKTVPVSEDLYLVEDSAASNAKKKVKGKNALAGYLASASTEVRVGNATAPTSGQVLTATSTTTATWQNPGLAYTAGDNVGFYVPRGIPAAFTTVQPFPFEEVWACQGVTLGNRGAFVFEVGSYMLMMGYGVQMSASSSNYWGFSRNWAAAAPVGLPSSISGRVSSPAGLATGMGGGNGAVYIFTCSEQTTVWAGCSSPPSSGNATVQPDQTYVLILKTS